MQDTIFALSSGAPPAGIGVIRISGPQAGSALEALAGRLPPPRRAQYAVLNDPSGDLLDQAMILWLPGPGTATGEDMAELHCHGGRAVIAAVESALAAGHAGHPKLRRATPGEFTRRAFANGRIDLAEAEGLGDLLSAETELQRRSALALAGGAFSRTVENWREELLSLSARVEAELDFSDEDDVSNPGAETFTGIDDLRDAIFQWLQRPRAEVLKEGFRVVIAGPPNAGKSTLFNALVESEAAITAPVAGTTRDVLMRPIALEGIPFLFADTAGLRSETDDAIEAIGIQRAENQLAIADLVLWLGEEGDGPSGSWEIEAQIDRADHAGKSQPRHRISALTGKGLGDLRGDLITLAQRAMPRPGEVALNQRQHHLLGISERALTAASQERDPLLVAENFRLARSAFDSLLGRTTTEDMLDALFGQFCIGK